MCKARTHRGFAVKVPEFIKQDKVEFVTIGGFRELAIKLANNAKGFIPADEQLAVVEQALQAIVMTEFTLRKQIDGSVKSTTEVVNFVESTVGFIRTGYRRLPVFLWADLLEYTPDDYAEISSEKTREFCSKHGDILDLTPSELVRRWVSQPNGIQDLIMSMDLIFSEKSSDEEKPVMYT